MITRWGKLFDKSFTLGIYGTAVKILRFTNNCTRNDFTHNSERFTDFDKVRDAMVQALAIIDYSAYQALPTIEKDKIKHAIAKNLHHASKNFSTTIEIFYDETQSSVFKKVNGIGLDSNVYEYPYIDAGTPAQTSICSKIHFPEELFQNVGNLVQVIGHTLKKDYSDLLLWDEIQKLQPNPPVTQSSPSPSSSPSYF